MPEDREREKIIQKNREKLETLRKQSEKVIYKASTFSITNPTTIYIDREKITIVQRPWWIFQKRFPILIKDIKTVVASIALIFGEIILDISGYETNPDIIRPFWPGETLKVKRILLGLVIATREGIDLSVYDDKELMEQIEKIGESHAR